MLGRAATLLGLAITLLCATSCGDDDPAGPGGGGATSAATGTGSPAATTASGGTAASSTGSGGGGGAETCTGKTGMAGDHDPVFVMSSGAEREYAMHVPPSYDPEVPTPVVLGFHGYGEGNDAFASVTHLAEAADEAGFIVVFPQGTAPLGIPGWNAGSCCGSASIGDVPDVQLVADLLDQIATDYCVDERRVFATGFSNGGMLSHRLACELSDRIAAIGAVAGTMAIPDCTPSRPVPVLHVHGTSDPVVAWDGGALAQGVPDTITGWIDRNGCGASPMVVYEQGSARCELFDDGCTDGAVVELCTVTGGGHDWPGGGTAMGMGDLVATDVIAEFFAAHPMP
jgi:polyhydroxybutyrate depolymerase